MNRFNPKKLLNSKWTAINPEQKEKHFIVTKLHWDEEQTMVMSCDLEAVMTKNTYNMPPEELKSLDDWLQGWK